MSEKSRTIYETEMIVPMYPEDNLLHYVADKIREVATPVLVVRFEDKTGVEAQAILSDLNREIESRGLSGFPPVSKRRIREERE